jgi:hypothetical protein
MAKWTHIMGKGNLKHHVVPAHLAQEIAADLSARGMSFALMGNPSGFMLDGTRGMCYSGRPKLSLRVLGLSLTVVCENIANTLQALRSAPIRYTVNGREYIKLHDTFQCLVLTPAQRDTFVACLLQHVEAAEIASCEFYAHKKALNVVLAEAARKSTGAVLPPEAVGSDPHKRYRTPAGVN